LDEKICDEVVEKENRMMILLRELKEVVRNKVDEIVYDYKDYIDRICMKDEDLEI
jgi:hypothetical protein